MKQEREIFITEATRGLGAALTKAFANKGRNIVLNYRSRATADLTDFINVN